jgi:hypothetical protein
LSHIVESGRSFDSSNQFTASDYMVGADGEDKMLKGVTAQISLVGSSSSVGVVLLAVVGVLFLMKCPGHNQETDHAESGTDTESDMSGWELGELERGSIPQGLDSTFDEPSGENDLTSSLNDLPFASDGDESF